MQASPGIIFYTHPSDCYVPRFPATAQLSGWSALAEVFALALARQIA
jgi:hypothetical protein